MISYSEEKVYSGASTCTPKSKSIGNTDGMGIKYCGTQFNNKNRRLVIALVNR